MHFLNPKTDYAFKKIFGSDASQDILVSFLNAVLDLSGDDAIVEVTILDPRLVPKIEGMKDTYLDVRVKDQRERAYIVEMQVLNVEGFEKRVLYNACKAYVNQLGKGDPYHILSDVVAVTITDFTMFPDLERVVSCFRLRADENPAICQKDLELVFAELPKFTKAESELTTTLDRWLYFLRTARDLTAIPLSLAVEPAIVHAFELANRAGLTEDEIDYLETRERWIVDQQHIQKRAQIAEHKAQEAESKAQEAESKAQEAESKAQDAESKAQEAESKVQEAEHKVQEAENKAQEAESKAQAAHSKGLAEGKAKLLLRLLRRRFSNLSADIERLVWEADSDQLDEWSERIVDAENLHDVFQTETT